MEGAPVSSSSSSDSSSSSTLETRIALMKENIRAAVLRMHQPGRTEFQKLMSESENPWQSLSKVQENWGLGLEKCKPAISFLDALNQSRSTLYIQLFDHMKDKLDKQLDCIREEAGLLIMLRQTIEFLNVRDLKSIPISIIKRLRHVPDVYLHHLASKKLLGDLPVSIRRQAWELNPPLFVSTMEPLGRECIAALQAPAGMSPQHPPLRQLVDFIGHNEKLFGVFADTCAAWCREERQALWGAVLRAVLMGMLDDGHKIQSLGKLDEIAWIFDQRRKQGKLDLQSLLRVVEMLKHLIIGQATKERNALKKQHEERFGDSASVPWGQGTKRASPRKRAFSPAKKHIPKKTIIMHVKRKLLGPAVERVVPIPLYEPAKPKMQTIPDAVLRPLLDEAWQFLTDIDNILLFQNKVTDDVAPNYSAFIKYPMDLNTMQVRLQQGGFYLDLDDFHGDVMQMFRNCKKYNGPGSKYTTYATGLNKRWKQKVEELKDRLTAPPPPPEEAADTAAAAVLERTQQGTQKEATGEDAPDAASAPAVPSVKPFAFSAAAASIADASPRDALRTLLEQAWEYLLDLDIHSFFAVPVTDLIAPGYSQAIAKPMDLSTMRLKTGKRRYKSLTDFGADVDLMLANCFEFNKESPMSEVFQSAVLLQRAWVYLQAPLAAMLGGSWSEDSSAPPPPVMPLNLLPSASTDPDAPVRKPLPKAFVPKPLPPLVHNAAAPLAAVKPSVEAPAAMDVPEEPEAVKENIAAEVATEGGEDAGWDSDQGGRPKRARREHSPSDAPTPDAEDEFPPPEHVSVVNWVQCHECSKWRTAPLSVDTEGLPEVWVCRDNTWAPLLAWCEAEEELEDAAGAVPVLLPGDGQGCTLMETAAAPAPVPYSLRHRDPPLSSSSFSSYESAETVAKAPRLGLGLGLGLGLETVAKAPRTQNKPKNARIPAQLVSTNRNFSAQYAGKSALLASSEAAVEAMRGQQLSLASLRGGDSGAVVPAFMPRSADAGERSIRALGRGGEATEDGGPVGLFELPQVAANKRLLWALCMLRDPQIQGLLRRFLAHRLASIVTYIVREPSAGQASVVSLSALPTRPLDDHVLRLALQLCQLPLDYADAVPALDPVLLRVHVPLMLVGVIEARQARHAAAAAAAEASGGSAPARAPVTLAELRKISGRAYQQTRENLKEEAPVGPVASQARTELIESVAKFVLQLLN